MDKIYSGAVMFGLIEAKVGLAWNIFIGSIFLLISFIIYYNYNKTSKSENKKEKSQIPNWVALGSTIVGLLVIGSSYYKYYMALHSDTYAAMSGASLVSKGLKNLTGISIPGIDMSGGYIYTDTEL